jgi:hypothetical protein
MLCEIASIVYTGRMSRPARQKLYAYVDESGQDTGGSLFVVAVVITGAERDHLRRTLRAMERLSRKDDKKWTKARPRERQAYLHHLLQTEAFVGHLYYAHYRQTRAYTEMTIRATAEARRHVTQEPYQATVIIDGLGRPKRHRVAAGLRHRSIPVHKVRGIRDQADEFIRLADAVAGWVRDSLEGDAEMRVLLDRALRAEAVTAV